MKNRLAEQDEPLRALHSELFPEEGDFYYDSNNDVKLRNKGINPMSEAYQLKVNLRRHKLGVEPYMGSVGIEDVTGLISSWEYCERKLASE
ncbi:hypothetical protein BCV02_13005 [Vibrio breoganii]|uniref:Uncharacterized protein n=1 Tax=Vibrio breoganii TaxID=553239 RepID=A0AAP8MUJ6_9VIBR|nr:hypothetical protein [Vibrio breoganii]NMR71191.1 hypothetical protein [Vibrio breoganii]PMG01931.1 hypothetical protein BCV02_13005 [Vibrio breoganii]PML88427.1 hypothetical protein BCT67_09815 [Vibrio breoganii]PMO71491.1 hypothetical protein BCT02_15790 [Vibrio breoganii]